MSVDGMAAHARRLAEMEAAQASREQQARSEWETLATRARALGQPVPEAIAGRLSTVLAARADALGSREEAIAVLERSLSDWRAGLERIENEDLALRRLRDRLRSTLADEIELSPAELSRVVARAFGERRRTGPLRPVRTDRGPSPAVEQEAALLGQLIDDDDPSSLEGPVDTVVHPPPDNAGTRTVEAARIEEYDPVTLDPFVAFEDNLDPTDDALVTLTGDGPADIGALLDDTRTAVRRPRSLMRSPPDDVDDIDIDIDIDEADLDPGEETLARWLGTTVEPPLEAAEASDAVDAAIDPLDDADSLLEWEAAGLGQEVAMLVERRRPPAARTSVNEIARDPFDAFDDFDDSLDAPFGFVENVTGQGPALEGADWSMDDGPTPAEAPVTDSEFDELQLDDPFAEESAAIGAPADGDVVDTGEIDGVDLGEAFDDIGAPLGSAEPVVEVDDAFESALSAAFSRSDRDGGLDDIELDAFADDERDIFGDDFAAELDAAFAEDAGAEQTARPTSLPVGASLPEASLPEPSVPTDAAHEADGAQPQHSDPRHSDPRHSDPRHSDPRHSDPRHSDPERRDPQRGPQHRSSADLESAQMRVTNRPTARPWSPAMADTPPGGSLLPAPHDPGEDGWGPRALDEPGSEPESDAAAADVDESTPDHVATDFGAALIDPVFDLRTSNPFEVPSLTQPAATPMTLSGSTDPGRTGGTTSVGDAHAAPSGPGALPLDLDPDAVEPGAFDDDVFDDNGFADTQLTGLDWPAPRALHAFPDGSMDSGAGRGGSPLPADDPRASAEDPWAALDSDILADALSDALAPVDGDRVDDTPFGAEPAGPPPVLDDSAQGSADATARTVRPAAEPQPSAPARADGTDDGTPDGTPGGITDDISDDMGNGIARMTADDTHDVSHDIWEARQDTRQKTESGTESGAGHDIQITLHGMARPSTDTAAYGAIDPDPTRRSDRGTMPFDPGAFARAGDSPELPLDPWRSSPVAPSASLADALDAARRADEIDPIDAALDGAPDAADEQRRVTDRFAALAGDMADDPWVSLDMPGHGDDGLDALPALMRRRQGRPAPKPERALPAPAAAPPSEPEPESAPRASLGVRVGIEAGDQFFTGFSRDISVDGMFVNTQHGLTVGQAVEVFFELPGGRAINARGLVRRVRRGDGGRPSGLGLRFEELTRDARVHIGRYVSRMLTGKIPLP